MNNILICGAHSFVAAGLSQKLKEENFVVEYFSRGENKRIDSVIYGKYQEIDRNIFFDSKYQTVINFAVIKDKTVEANINYIKSLIEFCKKHQVKKLIHFSSIMVYSYKQKEVNENTPIETLEETTKRGYGEFKIAVDQYLLSIKDKLPFELVLVRPGYVLADNRPCPFIKKLPFSISIIKGNKNSKQPIIRREDIYQALIKIIKTEKNDSIYHFFPNDNMTKYDYAKQTTKGIILTMPKWLFKDIPKFLAKVRIIPQSLYSRFEGMYIESHFSSQKTENKLKIIFN